MSRKTRPPLLVRVLVQLGKGGIREAHLTDKSTFVDGLTEAGGRITVNPADYIVDTVVHEILHRLYPAWSERYVKRTTTYLMRRMTNAEIRTIYEEYTQQVRGKAEVLRPKQCD